MTENNTGSVQIKYIIIPIYDYLSTVDLARKSVGVIGFLYLLGTCPMGGAVQLVVAARGLDDETADKQVGEKGDG